MPSLPVPSEGGQEGAASKGGVSHGHVKYPPVKYCEQ